MLTDYPISAKEGVDLPAIFVLKYIKLMVWVFVVERSRWVEGKLAFLHREKCVRQQNPRSHERLEQGKLIPLILWNRAGQ